MIQLVGYHIWDAADMRDSDTIIDADVTAGIEEARIDLDNAVCIPELQGLSKNDREYLEAMAASDGPSPTVNVAQRMGKTPNYAATYRKRLLDAFVIRETERGEVDFAVPFLREYLRSGISNRHNAQYRYIPFHIMTFRIQIHNGRPVE